MSRLRHLLIGVLAATGVLAVGGSPAAAEAKTKLSEVVQVNWVFRGDLAQMYREVEVVARVRIEGVTALPRPPRSGVVSEYRCRVVGSLLKGDTRVVGDIVVVRRGGGTRDDGDVLFESIVAGYPNFEVGEEYVLFARRNASEGALWVAREGTFGLRQGLVVPLGGSREAQRHARKDVAEFGRDSEPGD